MKINVLELNNFKNHEKTRVILDKFNFLAGKNNAGKSGILSGLEFALTGKKSAKSLIQTGKNEGIIEAEIEGLGIVGRTINNNGSAVELNNYKLPDRELEKEVLNTFNVSYDVLECVLNSHRFINMSGNEQRDFLFQISGVQLDVDKLISFLNNPTPQAKLMVRDSATGTLKFDELDKLYDKFYAARREAKKRLKDVEAAMIRAHSFPSVSVPDIAQIKREKQDAQTQRDKLLLLIGTEEQKQKQRKQLEVRLSQSENKLVQLTLQQAPGVTEAEIQQLPVLKKHLETEVAAENDLKTKIKVAEEKNKTLTQMINKLNTPQCPLNSKLVCNTDKSVLEKELALQVKTNKSEVNNAADAITKTGAVISEIRSKIQLLEEQKAVLENIAKEREAVEAIKNDLNALAVSDVTALSAELQEVNEKLKALALLEENTVKLQEQIAEYTLLQVRYKNIREEVDTYEYLVFEFAANGVKSRILKKVIAPFEKYCNDNMALLMSVHEKIAFDFTQNPSVYIENKNGKIDVSNLSSSEKVRLGIIFQDAFNNLTAARILVIDNFDILDDENAETLLTFLKAAEDRYDTIIAAGTMLKLDAINLFGQMPDSNIYFVEDGKAELCYSFKPLQIN